MQHSLAVLLFNFQRNQNLVKALFQHCLQLEHFQLTIRLLQNHRKQKCLIRKNCPD